MIIFKNISKKYGDNLVLDDINLTIEGGEFVSLIGHSGAGKTTLIQLLIGAEKPDFGFITVDDYNVTNMDRNTLQYYRRKLGIVFQDLKLLPKKTVYENVAFVMEVCETSDEEIKKAVPEALELVGLLDRMNQFPDQLSGGEKQKACIARAIVHRPRLLIADEPTGNLDPESTREIVDILLKIHARDTTVLFASHDNQMIDYIRKRVIMLHEGRMVSDEQEGTYELDMLKQVMNAPSQMVEIHIDGEDEE
ncbi:ATP-binding cassette domain-containing protein [Candidatus Peregrinibacteria bacterium]|nr:ATP-binding cassette domain-containing protein [Candidatus Peregrinibacteria bacterium]